MQQIDLKNFLSAVDVPADWVGIREVSETHTPRTVSYTHLTLPTIYSV